MFCLRSVVPSPFSVRTFATRSLVGSLLVLLALAARQPAIAQTVTLGGNWMQQSPAASPPAREESAMAYDAATGQVVLFGGQYYSNGSSGLLNDTWVWNGSAWSQSSSSGPSSRYLAAMAYDAATQTVVLFGGTGGGGPMLDTWTWNGTWTQQNPSFSPAKRYGAAALYDAATGQVVLFGGNTGTAVLADTYNWNGSTWVTQSPATVPPARFASQMTYDAATGQVVLFGGQNASYSLIYDT